MMVIRLSELLSVIFLAFAKLIEVVKIHPVGRFGNDSTLGSAGEEKPMFT